MTTPARRQYLDIKAQHQDAILLYQIGDFFETFDDDARTAARELQIALTGRLYGPGEHVPLAGVPIHALDTYAARLVARGYKVAICEQTSPPGRGLVRREVTRILTPGTVVEPSMVPATRDNYLVAVAIERRIHGKKSANRSDVSAELRAGLAYVDASTGNFACVQWAPDDLPDALTAELQRLMPAEVLLVDGVIAPNGTQPLASIFDHFTITSCPSHYFDAESARIRLCRHFSVPTLAAFGCEDLPLATAAAGAILTYLERMNPALLRLLTGLRHYDTSAFVEVDGRTWRALEVLEPSRSEVSATRNRTQAPTLLATLDATRTAMGARLLRRQLLQPLKDRLALEDRLDAVAELHGNASLREHIAVILDGLGDLERLTARIVHGAAVPRELHALAHGLERVPQLAAFLRAAQAPALQQVRASLDHCPEVCSLIERGVADPALAEGRTIRAGFHEELDALVDSIQQARAWIAALETTERERTGIRSLKVGFNKVFGYYLEVSRPNLSRVPPDYQRKQTLANGERFVTTELKEHEALVVHAEEQIAELERTLYNGLLREIAAHQARMRATALAFAQADVWLALAEVAVARRYVRPELDDSTLLEIVHGRHPIVEATLDGAEFTPNDIHLDALSPSVPDAAGARIILLTGPNMAGKSTFLRQIASIVLLAQIGSFVPATHARIGLVDRIFTRVGAEDDLARGLSTFMLEMVETAYILRHATARSLVVLDEVGRGTSTHDGLAIARAVIEHLHDTLGARTLFATHYHELSALSGALPHLRIFQMAVSDRDGDALFLHRIIPGASDHSYGVQVARMAGLPTIVTERAAALLNHSLSEQSGHESTRRIAEYHAPYISTAPDTTPPAEDIPLEPNDPTEPPGTREVTLALASLNIAAMTPLEALNLLFSLQQRALVALHIQRG